MDIVHDGSRLYRLSISGKCSSPVELLDIYQKRKCAVLQVEEHAFYSSYRISPLSFYDLPHHDYSS
jgi:hypothetical protein